ncbi:CP family cyanate transporter-like MFS transporter [Nocardia tenerifensis]|uniref:CP family cyanate transporter-like MFS transporter n=1 Tax=Nocardia tenerifensis TaxID=228006 RepID=A0A318K7D8_9NOCA|nr:MFS transporter [Nocardia tenerifensis]PXX69258.1 CP family cyanate transporter-like MFS transporter [Nocardia tenerifensis]
MRPEQAGGATALASDSAVAVPIWLVATGVSLVALNLRPPITAVSTLMPQVQQQEGFTSTVASLLVAVPIACWVGFSGLTPRIGRELGLNRTIGFALLVLLAGFGIRLLPNVVALFVGTTVIGLAITVGNVLVPATIKRDHPEHVGLLTGLYTMSLYTGAAAASGLTLPLQHATGLGWRATLGLWAVPVVIAWLVWLPQLRVRGDTGAGAAPEGTPRSLWLQPLAWAVTVFFAMPALLFYAVSAWLPTILVDAGMDASLAGGMLSIANLVAVPSALAMSILVNRSERQVWAATSTGAVSAIAFAGLMISPVGGVIAWMILLGIGLGAGTAIGYSLPLLRSRDAQTAAKLTAMSQIAGFALCAVGPVLAGALHDLTHAWTAVLLLLLALAVVQIVSGLRAGTARFVA